MEHLININFAPGGLPAVAHVSQYDDTLRVLKFQLWFGRNKVEVPDDASVRLDLLKPDGHIVLATGTVDSDDRSIVTVETSQQMTAVGGASKCVLVIVGTGNERISSDLVVLHVHKDPVEDGDASASDLSYLQDAIDQTASNASSAAASATAAAASATAAAEAAASITTDTTLSESGKAADAAVTGTEISNIKADLDDNVNDLKSALNDLTDATAERIQSEPITETISATFTDGAVDVSGNITASTSYHYTQKLSVKPGDVFATNGTNIRIVTAYNGDSVVPEKGVSSTTNTYTVPDGIDGIILTLYAAATTITKTYVEYTLVNSMQYLRNAVVRYDETQTLTDAQKTTARNNIGLNDILGDIDNRIDTIADATVKTTETSETTQLTPSFTVGFMNTSGEVNSSETNYHYSEKLSASEGDVFATSGVSIRGVTAFIGNTAIPEKGSTATASSFTVPAGIDGVVLSTYVTATNINKTHTTVETVSAITQTVVGANLIDKTLAVTGAINNAGNVDASGSGSNYKTSDYIPIFANKTYTLYFANSTGQSQAISRLIYLLYDTEKNVGTYVNQNGVSNLTISPTEDGYIRVATTDNSTPPYFSDLLMLIEGTTIIPYEDYKKEEYLSDDINPINGKAVAYFDSRFALDGKKWAHCGDSASDYTNATFRNGRFIGKYKTFPRLIAERNHMTLLQDFMLGGRTLAYPSDGTFHNSLCDPAQTYYYQNIPNDTDYITIMLGGNDCQHTGSGTTTDGEDATGAITLGTISDGDPETEGAAPTYSTATYYGAYNAVCYWLRVNRPYAHVGIVIENMTRRPDYTAAQIAIAKKWGYPYINLNGDERTPTMIRSTNSDVPSWIKDLIMASQSVNAPSDTHPNWQTHELESRFFEAWLRSI